MGEVGVNLVQVDPRFPGVWESVKGYLDEALNKGGGAKDWTLDDVLEWASKGGVQMWAGVKGDKVFGSAVTMEKAFPRRKVLHILLMGARAEDEADWKACFDQLGNVAKLRGCAAVTGAGRPGWARKLGAIEHRSFEVEL